MTTGKEIPRTSEQYLSGPGFSLDDKEETLFLPLVECWDRLCGLVIRVSAC
jgi:hypothetical protein